MSWPILELCHCRGSSIKICCDRLYNGGGGGGGVGVGGVTLGGDDRVARADRTADIQCSLLSAANCYSASPRFFFEICINLDINPARITTPTLAGQ